jgi:hypothetical protein
MAGNNFRRDKSPVLPNMMKRLGSTCLFAISSNLQGPAESVRNNPAIGISR